MASKYTTNKSLNIGLIAEAIEKGVLDVNDPAFLNIIENAIGQKITPRNPADPTKLDPEYLLSRMNRNQARESNNGVVETKKAVTVQTDKGAVKMPVVKTELPLWLDKKYSKEEMYKMATESTDKKIMGSHVLKNKDFSTDMRLAMKKWATPELFEYISMKGPRAEAELRAAMYPLDVGFEHRIFRSDGRYYMVPYITIMVPDDKIADHNKGFGDARTCATSYSFYCNQYNEVHCIPGDVVRVYSESEYRNYEEMRKASFKDFVSMKDLSLRVPLVHPKMGERQYSIIDFNGTEGGLEKRKFGHDYHWVQWKDITNFYDNGNVDFDGYWGTIPIDKRIEIDKAGKEAIAKIHSELLNESEMIPHHFTLHYDKYKAESSSYERDEYYRDGDTGEWEQL